MAGDVLGLLVQGPAHAPGHDLGEEVVHDPGDAYSFVDAFWLINTNVVQKQNFLIIASTIFI